ncbi:BnaCnng19340D [Brassica napus]|uniref:BnaCnng19340D protein n=1 Tax=Brassica napus TaxID=3708 RepID=A0A078IHI6_BRANA|nr:BnaCnng19340D [Brassica napus]
MESVFTEMKMEMASSFD